VEDRFNAEEWDRLTSGQRVRRCRLWAVEAMKLAAAAPVAMKQHYASIAERWSQLAEEIEKQKTESL
jgi:hypothetical protein